MGAISIAGCGDDNEKESINNNPSAEARKAPNTNKIGVEVEYFSDGSRKIVFDDENSLDTYSTILGFCDGPDYVEITAQGSGTGLSRSPDHKACLDGSLTPSDFEPPIIAEK